MSRSAETARQVASLLRIAKQIGIKPHIWVDGDGCVHLVELSETASELQLSTRTAEDPWELHARS